LQGILQFACPLPLADPAFSPAAFLMEFPYLRPTRRLLCSITCGKYSGSFNSSPESNVWGFPGFFSHPKMSVCSLQTQTIKGLAVFLFFFNYWLISYTTLWYIVSVFLLA
jgi:hypothetical protein